MFTAQQVWTEKQGILIRQYCAICGGICELSKEKPPLSKLKYKIEIRKNLIDSTYYFLIRYYKIRLLTKDESKHKCDLIRTNVDSNDLGQIIDN